MSDDIITDGAIATMIANTGEEIQTMIGYDKFILTVIDMTIEPEVWFGKYLNETETIDSITGNYTSGTYFRYLDESTYVSNLTVAPVTKKIDEIFLPEFATVAKTGSYNDLIDTPTLSIVATTGNYNDLINKPTIDQTYSPTSENAQSGLAVAEAVNEVLATTELLQNHIRIVEGAPVTTTTISFADKANRTSFDKTIAQVWEQNGIKVIHNKGTGSNIGDYANPIRFYTGSEVIIEYPNMTKIEIIADQIKYVVTADSITDANAVATVTDTVTTITLAKPVDSFTIPVVNAQARVMSMTITSGTESETYLTSLIPQEDNDVINKKYFDVKISAQDNKINTKQDILISGENIKTINGESILGEGDINEILDYITYTMTDNRVTITDCDTLISGSYIIPNAIEGYPVTSIGGDAFSGCTRLTSITIPDSVTSIGYRAFSNCTSLTSITIGGSVTSIGNSAFYWCTSLTSITIPDSVTSIDYEAFSGCQNLTSIIIGGSVTSIGTYAFSNCNRLTDVYYKGTQEEWSQILIGSANEILSSATIHYNQELATKEYVLDTVANISGGTTDYTALANKPTINGVELVGNKTTSELGIIVPTKLSELENDNGYINNTALATYYTQTESDSKYETQSNSSLKLAEAKAYTDNAEERLASEIATERTRITNLATLTEGSTTGDAELIDIRVGANNEIYSSAGDSVRKQFGHIESICKILPTETKSIAPTITKQTMWKITDGVVERAATNSTAYSLCEPIEVEESTICEVTVKSYATAVNSIIVVDENYMVLYSYNANLTEEIATAFRVPIGAKYLLVNTVTPTSINPAPTVTITSYRKTAAEETVTEIKNKAEYLWENSTQNISKINATIKERTKHWLVEEGKMIFADGTSTAHIACTEIPVKFGQIITVTTLMSGTTDIIPAFAIVDSDYNILYKSTQTEETVAVPFGSAFVVINAFSAVDYSTVTIKDIDILSGKTVAVIGDSISTKIDLNAVEMTITEEDVGVELSAYLTYYDVNTNALSLGGHTFTAAEIGTEVTFTPNAGDIGKVIGSVKNYNGANTATWWEVAQKELGFSTIPVCWSGASITSHEANVNDKKCSHSWHESQIRKCGVRVAGSMNRIAPDAIVIFRGCNDMTHEPYTTITKDYFDSVDFGYPTTDFLEDGKYGFKEGYVILISKLRERYPNAKIFLCTLSVFKRVNYDNFPTNNGINTLPQYNNAIREIADYMGCGLIEFDKCGITFENCYSEGYIVDSSTTPTHPSAKGHMLMANKAMHDLKN